MTDNQFLIEGLNPLTISGFSIRFGKRYGIRKDWSLLMKKKNPIRGGVFGLYEPDLYDGWYPARLGIYGADGSVLKWVGCKSNAHALKLKAEYTKKLNNFVDKISDTRGK
jgi:hypothetical protein